MSRFTPLSESTDVDNLRHVEQALAKSEHQIRQNRANVDITALAFEIAVGPEIAEEYRLVAGPLDRTIAMLTDARADIRHRIRNLAP